MLTATLFAKPSYVRHRQVTGAPVLADTTVLANLINITAIPPGGGAAAPFMRRDIIDCGGWKSIRAWVKLTGGTTPTIDLVPLEIANYEDDAGDEHNEFVIAGAASGGLSTNETHEFTINGGLLFLRINALTGSPTGAGIYVVGEEILERDPGAGRKF